MELAKLHGEIVRHLSLLNYEIKILNSLNINHLNIYAESFYEKFLNLMLGYHLVCNEKSTETAIDLYDRENKIAFQITSNSEINKYTNTVNKFISNDLHKTYSTLIVLILGEKRKSHKKNILGEEGVFLFDIDRDVWDINTIAYKLKHGSLNDLQKIYAFTSEYLGHKDRGDKMGVTNNFNGSITINGAGNSLVNEGSIHNVITNYNSNGLDRAKGLFDMKMFSEAKSVLKDVVLSDPDNKEACMYYVLSCVSGVNISRLSEAEINHLYVIIERFGVDNFFKIMWLIVFYEYDDVNLASFHMIEKRNKVLLDVLFSIDDKILNFIKSNIQLNSKSAPGFVKMLRAI